jgi:hypothetical protein
MPPTGLAQEHAVTHHWPYGGSRTWCLAIVGIVASLAWLSDWAAPVPSRETAERLLRYAVDGNWKVHREDGVVEAPGNGAVRVSKRWTAAGIGG